MFVGRPPASEEVPSSCVMARFSLCRKGSGNSVHQEWHRAAWKFAKNLAPLQTVLEIVLFFCDKGDLTAETTLPADPAKTEILS